MLKLILDAQERDGKHDAAAKAAMLIGSTAMHREHSRRWPKLVPF
ncbi:hypothetical protein BN2476_240021 [Paraburkholderia piptadeniae]|uniref:Uncharacterized protein n=1 Tax=Paraburkholderia piptadeniae TaxID=1701573 RepID=A0A1N7RZK9_9BURK|nr:hypothetical protein [Paraburkholderia piptadeniae]SIT40165.1 hypothetical protein BN2476_240021 [Paraburkholderia piptadeniae]